MAFFDVRIKDKDLKSLKNEIDKAIRVCQIEQNRELKEYDEMVENRWAGVNKTGEKRLAVVSDGEMNRHFEKLKKIKQRLILTLSSIISAEQRDIERELNRAKKF